MAVTFGFFDSINGDRVYNADQISNYFLKLISNGVFATPSNAMQVVAASGMGVSVTAGWGFINCKWINNDSDYSLTLDAADIALNRIDRVVLRLNPATSARNIVIDVKKGTAAATPDPPALTREAGGIWELSLAQIAVAANATAITQADITDERPDTSVCGFVTGLIDQIDTTSLFAQFTSAFYNWFDAVKADLSKTTLVTQYSRVYTTTEASEDEIAVGIQQYNFALDILNVYVNGLKLVPGVDYTLDDETLTITLTEALDEIGTQVEFEVLKSLDSSGIESFINIILSCQQQLGGLSFEKCTQAEYDAMASHDENTVYIVPGGGS